MIRSRLITCLVFAALCTTPNLMTAQATMAAETQFDGKPIKGTVLETMNTSGYTYMHVEAAEGAVWVAVPETKVTKGQEVVAKPGMTMTNFESKTLNRTFDAIIFSSGIGNGAKVDSNPHGSVTAMGTAPAKGDGSSFAEAMKAEQGSGMAGGAAAGAAMAGMEGASGSSSNIVPSKDVTVEKAQGDNAFTVEE